MALTRGLLLLAFNTFADGSLAILPVTIFWTLSTNKLHRIQLSIVFGLNIFTCICSGIKTQYLVGLANRTDLTWATFDIFAWVTVELFLMIVCGTVPTLHPILTFVQYVIDAIKAAVKARGSDSHDRKDSKNRTRYNQAAADGANELITIGRMRSRMPDKRKNQAILSSQSCEGLFDSYEATKTDVALDAYVNGTLNGAKAAVETA